ncbi:MAG: fused MFS/spermidine synthase, partial [Candidatus Saccharimonadales bacterium]|nr:fused MFS/spermidine synthase [Candidatus Saccharimonadales bacterium]
MSNKQPRSFLKMLKDNDLHAWVFTTGAIVLIIEVVAVRILAPYFGNTLFAYSSVISVILLALSAGYWYGGQLADRKPERRLFYSLIAAGGLLLLFIETFREPLLEAANRNLSLTTGPLLSSIILFIGPALLLGMLSPMAIKIRSVEQPKTGIGTIAGGMFFWSTLGSISGSLAAGFWLVPTFGVDAIMLSQGVILILLGGLPLLRLGVISLRMLVGLFALTSGLGVFSAVANSVDKPYIIYESDGIYEH